MTDDPKCILSKRRVLIVEDERLIALDVQDILEQCGCCILEPVGTVESALDIVRRDPPDLAVLDVNLGDGTSEPIAAALHAIQRPFLVLSAYRPKDLAGALVNARVVNKPVDERKLLRELAELVTCDDRV